MINIDGKVYRNLQEQVEENMKNIRQIIQVGTNIGRIIGHVDDAADLPASPPYPYTAYDYGIGYTVGEETPYDIYLWNTVNGSDMWENQGTFPAIGPAGPAGPTGPQGPQGDPAGFGTPTATIDANVGTPAVSVTASGPNTAKIFSFSFSNLKGEKGDASIWKVGNGDPSGISGTTGDMYLNAITGDVYRYEPYGGGSPGWVIKGSIKGPQGNTGAAAGFGNPTATIDANVGTPAVTITASGPDTAKIFNFAFSNLKGQKGDTGANSAVWYCGSTDPYTPGTVEGDMYLRLDNANIWRWMKPAPDQSATWVYQGTISPDLTNKADIDGTYPDMSVGHATAADSSDQALNAQNADQLTATVGITDRTPYNFRTSGGSVDIGDREEETIVGGSIVWNQLIDDTAYTEAACSITKTNHDLAVSFNASSNNPNFSFSQTIESGHVYALVYQVSNYANMDKNLRASFRASGIQQEIVNSLTNETVFVTADNNYTSIRFQYYGTTGESGATITVSNIMLLDITKMFKSTVANFLATDANAAPTLISLFPQLNGGYYAQNLGTLMSVNTSAHKMVGFNQWDEEWEVGTIDNSTGQNSSSTTQFRSTNYIPVFPDTDYYVRCPVESNGSIFAYDVNQKFISRISTNFTSKIITTPSNCYYIRFKSGPTYGPTYNNDICINISWSGYRNGQYEPYQLISYDLEQNLDLDGIPTIVSGKIAYDGDIYASDGTVTRNYETRAYASGDESLTDAITDGTNTVIKKATPSTESAAPYTSPQKVNVFGTEQYVDYPFTQGSRAVKIPVGHVTFYPENLRDSIQKLIPLPTSAGTYGLQVTVVSGHPVYSWVSLG